MIITCSKPPALNHLYGVNKFGGKYLKSKGKAWKEEFMWRVRMEDLQNWDVPCSLTVKLFTAKHQDNDGILKLLQDSIQAAGIIKDDYWIFDLRVLKFKVKKAVEEKIELEIKPIENEEKV